MRQSFGIFLVLSTLSFSALAYKDGTYACQSGEPGVPKSEYKFSTVEFAGTRLPLVEVNRFYRQDSALPTSPVVSTQIKGIGTLTKTGDREAILLGYLRFEFNGDELLNCK